MGHARCMWCGNRDEDVADYGAQSRHEACMMEAGRRANEGLCSLCGRTLPEGRAGSCGADDCYVQGYPP